MTITANRPGRAPLADGETRTYTRNGAYVTVQRTRFTYTVTAGFLGGFEVRELASTHPDETSANHAARRIAELIRDGVRVDLIPAALTPPPLTPTRRPAPAAPKGAQDELSEPVARALEIALRDGGTVGRGQDADIKVLQAAAKRGWLDLIAPRGTYKVTAGQITDAGKRRVQRWLRDTGQTATSRATAVLAA